MLSPEFIQQLEQYVRKQLSEEQARSLEQQLEESAEIRQEAEAYITLFEGFAALELEQFQQQMQQWEAKHQTKQQPVPTTGVLIRMRQWVAKYRVAAAIALISVPLGYVAYQQLNPNPTSEELFASNFTPDIVQDGHLFMLIVRKGTAAKEQSEDGSSTIPPTEEIKKAKSIADLALENGINEYNKKQFEQAAAQFELYLNNPEIEASRVSEVKFYLGVSYLAKGNLAQSIAILQKLTETSELNTFQDESEWFLALALLKDKKMPEAEKLLKRIARPNQAHPYKEKAAALLKKMRAGVR